MNYSLGDLTIDSARQQVSRGAEPVALPKLSYDLLLALVRAAPKVVSLDELMRLVWPGGHRQPGNRESARETAARRPGR
jgi:DNA-binding winged helix-turn-helix (wHTH) protein